MFKVAMDKVRALPVSLYQGSAIETHRDRPCGPSGRREAAGDAVASSRLSDALRRAAWTTEGGFPRLSDVVAHALRCPASPRRTLLAENLGKPSL